MKKFIQLIILIGLSTIIFSCGGGGSSENISKIKKDNYSLNLNIKFRERRGNYGKFSDIIKILLDVNSSDLDYVKEQEFEKGDGGKWTIDLIQLPMDKDLTFKVQAFIKDDDKDKLSYIDNQVFKLVDGENNITMILKEIETLAINKVMVQSLESNVTKDADDVNYTTLHFSLYNKDKDELKFIVTADTLGEFNISDGAPEGIIDSYDDYAEAVLDINYTRPAEAGTYKNRLKLINTRGDIFIYVFNLTVNDTDEVYIGLNEIPEIENFIATAEDSNLSVEINATDPDGDTSTLTYHWSLNSDSKNGSGADLSLDEDSASTKTAIVTGYDKDDIVILDISITDANGSTTTGQYKSAE